MAYDGWIEFGGIELVNLSRTAQLAETLGIDTVWTDPTSVAWIETALGGVDYDLLTAAPWYDAGFPASAEFAGIVPLAVQGLDDSTLTGSTTEYIGDGGYTAKARNTTGSIVASAAIVASTERGAEYGKRWLDKVLRGEGDGMFCAGDEMRYFRYSGSDSDIPPVAHRRNVRTTRGVSITKKRVSDCSSTWLLTFTLTANDPYEYGESVTLVTDMGNGGDAGLGSGHLELSAVGCPVYDYSPIYDPTYPALAPAPAVPNFYPDGWGIAEGTAFERYWVRVAPSEPGMLNSVPVITLSTATDARFVRVSVMDPAVPEDSQCDALFTVIVSYLPAGRTFVIDGEQKAAYVTEPTRRTDSLVYGPDAAPVQWTSFSDPSGLLIAVDLFAADTGTGYAGDGTVRMDFALVPKSD